MACNTVKFTTHTTFRRFHASIAVFLVAFYLVAAARFLMPGVCVGMCAPLPSDEVASLNAIRACCTTSMPLGGSIPASPDDSASGCALCSLLTAPGAPSALVAPAIESLESSPIRVAFEQSAHTVQVHAPGMPRDPPFAARTL